MVYSFKLFKKALASLLSLQIVLSLLVITLSLPGARAAGPWYDAEWMYRVPLTVHNPNATPLSDYQAEITLDNTSFDFAEALPNGADLRITDSSSSTIYPHWFEKYSQVDEKATIWVRIPSIPANGDANLYIYFGNTLAPQASNGLDVFPFFDDFEDQNIDDWTIRTTSPGPYFVRGNPVFFESGRVTIRESMNNYGYIKKAFSGSLEGKVLESLIEYGHPSYNNPGMGADAHPRLTVLQGSNFDVGFGASSAAFLPMTRVTKWIDQVGTYGAAITNYSLQDRVVNRISFIDANTIQLALRGENSNIWEAQEDVPYTVSNLDNGEIALGKLPREDFTLGGGLGTHQWDWVRIRTYAENEATFTVGSRESETLLVQMQLSSSMPGRLQTQYNFTVTPNQPIPNGGKVMLTFPVSFAGNLQTVTPSSISVASHAQITSTTSSVDATARTITLTFSSSAPIIDPIRITIGDSVGMLGDIRNPSTGGPHQIDATSYDESDIILATGNVQMSASGWWNDSWLYRKSFHINNTKVRSELTDYAVQLNLDASNFDFSHANTNGEDLRFVLPDGQSLEYWIESYDAVGEKARVWIKIPTLPSSTEIMIFMYFGNSSATVTSNGTNVFPFFDDFEDNDISDWTQYSATPGAITVTGGDVHITEQQDNNAYIRRSYTGPMNNIAVEAVVRYIQNNIGESYHPHVGFYDNPANYVSAGPVRYSFGNLPTNYLRQWANLKAYDDPGTDYGANEDITIMVNTAQNYYLTQTKRNEETAWGAQSTQTYDTSALASPLVQLGKYAYDILVDSYTGGTGEHAWRSVRVRNFVYFEPLVLLGSEENNALPSTPTDLYINTLINGAATSAADPMAFTDNALAVSAVYNNDNTSELATHYDIEVASDPAFTTIIRQSLFQPLTTALNDGVRSEDIALPTDLPYNSPLYVQIRFYDSQGQISPSVGRQFQINDTTFPTIGAITPTHLAVNVVPTTPVSFELRDNNTVNILALQTSINGLTAIANGICQIGFSCTIAPTTGGYNVTITPAAPLPYSTDISLEVEITDVANNTTISTTTFRTIDTPTGSTPPPTTGGSGGGGYISYYSAPAQPTNDEPSNSHSSASGSTIKPSLPTKNNTIGNSCENMQVIYNYTLPEYLPGNVRTDILFLEKFGINFSKTTPRVLDPYESISRSEILKYLLQLSCADYDKDLTDVPRFPDVSSSHPDDFYIHLGRKYSLVHGYIPSGLFIPDKNVSMGEALKITIRDILSNGKSVNGILEVPGIDYSQWHAPYLRYATDKGLIQRSFDPNKTANLKEVMELFRKAIEQR